MKQKQIEKIISTRKINSYNINVKKFFQTLNEDEAVIKETIDTLREEIVTKL